MMYLLIYRCPKHLDACLCTLDSEGGMATTGCANCVTASSLTRRRLWFLLSSWTGSEAVRGSFKARGYLLGTSQVWQKKSSPMPSGSQVAGKHTALACHAAAGALLCRC